MRINGFLGVSLIDYPGKICSIVYTSPCNFNCPFCHNVSLITVNRETLDEGGVLDDIYGRREFIDAVTVTGGEPVLQEDLNTFLDRIKKMGLLAKLDTNGYLPEKTERLINDGLVDYISMDIKSSPENYNRAAGTEIDIKRVYRSIGIIMNSKIEYEFRTTVVPTLVSNDDFYKIGKIIEGAKQFTIQQFDSTNTFSRVFKDIKPYSESRLNEFADIMRKYVKKVRIGNTAGVA